MPVTFLELFRTMSSFEPERRSLADAPWDRYADWAIAQGLAPLAAYNLEYRMGPTVGAPQWVKDRLLSIYQGSVNDNVMKLVGFKRSVDALSGRTLVLFGAATFAESLYPHVAFRPVIDLHLFVAPRDLEPFVGFLKGADFKPTPAPSAGPLAPTIVSDGRTSLYLFTRLPDSEPESAALLARATPLKVYGPSMRRFEWEDALLVHVLGMARAGFSVPLVQFVDLRELVLGAPFTGAYSSRSLDVEAVKARAAAWGLERALWTALHITARLFPQTQAVAERLSPQVALPVRELLERLIVAPVTDLERTSVFVGEEAVRHALMGV